MAREDQKEWLRLMLERIVVDPAGKIIQMELLPPFAYLHDLNQQAQAGSLSSETVGQTKTRQNEAGIGIKISKKGQPQRE